MHELYKLKETLCKELEEYGERTQLDKSSLEIVDTLAHALKNLDKVIESKEADEYSEAMSRTNMSRDGMSNYSRGTIEDGMGHYHWPNYTRYSERRSMEGGRGNSYRYSRDYSGNDMVDKLREMMDEVQDDGTRNDLRKLISKMERM